MKRFEMEACSHNEHLVLLHLIPRGIMEVVMKLNKAEPTYYSPTLWVMEKIIRLEVPKGTINTDVCKELYIHYGILVYGPSS